MGEGAIILGGILAVPMVMMVVMALLLLNGRGAFLIAGYNTLSKSDKAKYDEKALCRFVGWLLIAIAFCVLTFAAGIFLEMVWIIFCGIALTLVVIIGGVVYANTGNRFCKSVHSEVVDASEKPKSLAAKSTIAVVIVISLIALIAVGILNHQGEKDPTVGVLDNTIQIEAMYGVGIDFSNVTDIVLIEKSMSDIGIGRRTNGYGGFGETLKGHFESDTLGETLLFVQSKTAPTIRIERINDKDVYISFRSSEETEQLYREMIAAM